MCVCGGRGQQGIPGGRVARLECRGLWAGLKVQADDQLGSLGQVLGQVHLEAGT